MNRGLVPKPNQEGLLGAQSKVPAIIMAAGERAGLRFLEFFTANIRNPNTRRAYYRACCDFLRWCQSRHLDLDRIGPMHVAAYIERIQKDLSKPSVKQGLAAIRMLFDWLVVGQVVAFNPASSVRGPKYSTKKGKTPVLSADEARQLLDSIDTESLVGLRDRALIALMTYTFARVGAAISMDVEDYYVQGRRQWVRLHEKGGKLHEMPAHHTSPRISRRPESRMRAALPSSGQLSGAPGSLPSTAWRNPTCTSWSGVAQPGQGSQRRSAITLSAPLASRRTSRMVASWRSPNEWPITNPHGRRGFTTAAVTRSRSMKLSGWRFERRYFWP
jgi:integrase